jgi:hypothetical protein
MRARLQVKREPSNQKSFGNLHQVLIKRPNPVSASIKHLPYSTTMTIGDVPQSVERVS